MIIDIKSSTTLLVEYCTELFHILLVQMLEDGRMKSNLTNINFGSPLVFSALFRDKLKLIFSVHRLIHGGNNEDSRKCTAFGRGERGCLFNITLGLTKRRFHSLLIQPSGSGKILSLQHQSVSLCLPIAHMVYSYFFFLACSHSECTLRLLIIAHTRISLMWAQALEFGPCM